MYSNVIDFWFDEVDRVKWFVKDDDFDQEISARFSGVHAKAVNCELWRWRTTALGSLAEIIVLDQFSRNMFRGQKESFIYDSLALALAQFAISKGFDSQLTIEQRSFLYMPFMHSESLAIHEEAVSLFAKLGVKENIDFEFRHKVILEQFGRYPHRNKILNRTSTAEELEYLLKENAGF